MADNFSSQILRGDLGGALIPDEISQEIIQTLPQSSVLLTRARRVPMSSKKKTQPVLASLPEAYWVSKADSSRRQRPDGRTCRSRPRSSR